MNCHLANWHFKMPNKSNSTFLKSVWQRTFWFGSLAQFWHFSEFGKKFQHQEVTLKFGIILTGFSGILVTIA